MRGVVRLALACLCVLMFVQPVAAQGTGFLPLGSDPQGDAKFQGQSNPDTIFDILSMGVKTEGTDLVFELGMRSTSSELAQVCFVAAFQVGTTEYLGFDCFECTVPGCDNTASGVEEPSSSRGKRVGTVSFSGNSAIITVPFSDIGVAPGDVIDDIYGLTYETRGLYVADAAPDAKGGDKASATSFGSYIVGADFIGLPEAVADILPAIVYEDLEAPVVDVSFTNATSDDYVYNFTNDLPAAVAVFDVNGTGFANATLVDGNGTELFNGTVESASIDLGNVTAGDWQLIVDFTDFNGTFGFDLVSPEVAADAGVATGGADAGTTGATADGNVTGNATLDGAENDAEAPGPALPVLGISLLVAAFAGRRRR